MPLLRPSLQPSGRALGVIRPNGGAYGGLGDLSSNVTPTLQIVAGEIGAVPTGGQ